MVSKLGKGVAEAVAAAIAFALVAISMLYIFLGFASLSLEKPFNPPPGYINEKLVLFQTQVVGTADSVLNVKNLGSTTSYISYVIAFNTTSLRRLVINLDKGSNICSASLRSIPPGDTAFIRCSPGLIPIAVITRNGQAFSIEPQIYAQALEKSYGIPMTTVLGGVIISSTSNLVRFIENRSLLTSRAINASTPLTLIYNSTQGDVSVSASLSALLMFIGLNPANNKYNLLIIGEGRTGSNTITVGGTQITLSQNNYPYRYRIKIENFTGYISRGIGIYPCYINDNSYCQISLNGKADRVAVYASNNANAVQIIGLDPYIFVGDLNNNSNADVVFVTEDKSIGNSSIVNDATQMGTGTVRYVDCSVKPMRIVFTNSPVDGSKYSTAILSMRMFFWDNSQDDVNDNDNRVILRVGLYDPQNKSFVYSTELSYYELNRYRNVRPFSVSYISKDFTIYIPKTSSVYYIAVEVQDPYCLSGTRNDADLIVGLEYIGIALSSR